MARFIHTADWQIGMKAAHVGAVGPKVRGERLEAAQRVVEVANAENADFIVVAGDTFEDNAVDRVLVQQVADILGGFSGTVYLIAGNHDPLVPGSVWDHAAWKSHDNLCVFRAAEPMEIEGVTLYPCPLFEKHSRKDPTRWVDATGESNIAVGIGHGTVEGAVQDELDYPISRDAPARAGLDYLALGHWHSYGTFESHDQVVRMAYAGTHETTKFGERDSGNVLLVEIPSRGAPPQIKPIRTGGLSWKSIHRELVASGDLARLRQEIESIGEPQRTLLDLTIEGVFAPGEHAEIARLEELVNARFLYGRIDNTRLAPSPDDDRWLELVPVGVLRNTALRLQELANPAYTGDRPDYASPEVAKRALLELYLLVHGAAS